MNVCTPVANIMGEVKFNMHGNRVYEYMWRSLVLCAICMTLMILHIFICLTDSWPCINELQPIFFFSVLCANHSTCSLLLISLYLCCCHFSNSVPPGKFLSIPRFTWSRSVDSFCFLFFVKNAPDTRHSHCCATAVHILYYTTTTLE